MKKFVTLITIVSLMLTAMTGCGKTVSGSVSTDGSTTASLCNRSNSGTGAGRIICKGYAGIVFLKGFSQSTNDLLKGTGVD